MPKHYTSRDDKQVTLRIHAKNLEAIACGEKKTEYRSYNEHYHRTFLESFNRVQFHFQTTRRVVVEVLKVEIVEGCDGDPLYAIRLGKVIRNEH